MRISQFGILFIMAFVLGISCKSNKQIPQHEIYQVIQNELRLYKIRSSMDATAYMYERFGNWDDKIQDEEKEHIRSYVWRDRDLLKDGEVHTIITSGIETMEEYFTSVKVLDMNGNLALDASNVKYESLIAFLKKAIDNHTPKKETYLMIKKNL